MSLRSAKLRLLDLDNLLIFMPINGWSMAMCRPTCLNNTQLEGNIIEWLSEYPWLSVVIVLLAKLKLMELGPWAKIGDYALSHRVRGQIECYCVQSCWWRNHGHIRLILIFGHYRFQGRGGSSLIIVLRQLFWDIFSFFIRSPISGSFPNFLEILLTNLWYLKAKSCVR